MKYSDLTQEQIVEMSEVVGKAFTNYSRSMGLPDISEEFTKATTETILDQINIAKMAEEFDSFEKKMMRGNKIKKLFKNS